MAGLDPAIHVLLSRGAKTWMPGTSPGMTSGDSVQARPNSDLRNMTPSLAPEAVFAVPGRLVLLLQRPKYVYEGVKTRHYPAISEGENNA